MVIHGKLRWTYKAPSHLPRKPLSCKVCSVAVLNLTINKRLKEIKKYKLRKILRKFQHNF